MSKRIPKIGLLDDNHVAKLIIAVLVKKLGGSVIILQTDIDEVSFNRLYEESDYVTDSVRLYIEDQSKTSQ